MGEPSSTQGLWLKASLVWLGLMLLLGLTLVGAYSGLGAWKLPLAMAIGLAKAGLVITLFMELLEASASARFAALAGVLWLALLFALTFADEGTRLRLPPGFPDEAAAGPDGSG